MDIQRRRLSKREKCYTILQLKRLNCNHFISHSPAMEKNRRMSIWEVRKKAIVQRESIQIEEGK